MLASAAIAMLASPIASRADTLYTLQVQASTIEEGSAPTTFYYPVTYTTTAQSAYASYDPASSPIIGCCSGAYTVSGSVSGDHGGTARANAFGTGAFVGSTLPFNPTGGNVAGQVAAYGKITTNFTLTGPASATPIPVFLDWAVSASSTGAGSAYADLLLYGGCSSCTSPVFERTATSGPYGGDPGSFSGLSSLLLIPNQPYVVISTARAADSSTYFNEVASFGTGSAFVDPLFSVAAAYADAYHLVGLPTGEAVVPPTAPVPEPPMTLLLGAGLAAFGITRVKRLT